VITDIFLSDCLRVYEFYLQIWNSGIDSTLRLVVCPFFVCFLLVRIVRIITTRIPVAGFQIRSLCGATVKVERLAESKPVAFLLCVLGRTDVT
jgi:hypothetical protein